MIKKLEWTKPVLVELGSIRRMSFGDGGMEITSSECDSGSGANACVGGQMEVSG